MIIAASFDVHNPEMWINRGLAYGDGLFETMRFNELGIPLIKYHLERLTAGLKRLNLNQFNQLSLTQALNQYLNESNTNIKTGVIKLTVFRSKQVRTYHPLTHEIDWLITVDEVNFIGTNESLKLSVADMKLSLQPQLAGMKHLSRLEQVMVADELNQLKDVDDLLVLDADDNVTESTYQNVVLIKGDKLYTPLLNAAGVSGVALAWLNDHFNINHQTIAVHQLTEFDGMILCNSVRGIRPVAEIKRIGKQPISFATSQVIHDKIKLLWNNLFRV